MSSAHLAHGSTWPPRCVRKDCSVQVGIIRQVEVELDNTLRDLRDSHKEEAAKLKKWRALDKDVQAKLAEFPIQGEPCLLQNSLHLLLHGIT